MTIMNQPGSCAECTLLPVIILTLNFAIFRFGMGSDSTSILLRLVKPKMEVNRITPPLFLFLDASFSQDCLMVFSKLFKKEYNKKYFYPVRIPG